jgi:predicted amidohydrolase
LHAANRNGEKGLSSLRVATVAWELRTVRGDGDFYGHFHDLVTVAHDEGAEVVVFPENHTLELVNLAPDLEAHDVPKFLMQFADELEAWIDRISRSSGMIIVGGSHLRETPEGIKNICAVGNGIDGLTFSEKANLTPYERNVWRLEPGEGPKSLPDSRLSVSVGHDCEISTGETGTVVHSVPAFTREIRGFQRVRWSARAGASQDLNYVVHASLVGDLGREPAPTTFGTSAILTPSYEPFPETATLGESEFGEESVIVRTLDLDLIEEVRLRYGIHKLQRENKPS